MHSKSRMRPDSLPNFTGTVQHNTPRISKTMSVIWSVLILIIGVLLVIAFFYIDRHGLITHAIQSTGLFGIVISVFLMALFCIIPVPSEFLMIMNMKVFGVWWGIFYTWIGAMIGAIAVFWAARHFGRHLLEAFVSENRVEQVNQWVGGHGAIGLLLARLVPLPFIVVNYTAGVLKSVRPIDYIWTTAIGLLPYDIGAALVFLGFSKKYTLWIVIGGIAVLAIWIAGYLFNRYTNKTKRWAH